MMLVLAIERKAGTLAWICRPTGELAGKVIPFLEPNDLVMTIGAGDVTSVGPQILDLLDKKS